MMAGIFSGSGPIASVDFTDVVTGHFTFESLPVPGNQIRMAGQFNTGLSWPSAIEYTFFLVDSAGNVVLDISEEVAAQININPPGSDPFQADFSFLLATPQDIIGLAFLVKHFGKVLSKGMIVSL